jgi:hypothetical protein
MLALIEKVLSEARDPLGTWSLATHQRVNESIASSAPENTDRFLTAVVTRLLSADATMCERFKLAQLCTMCHQKLPTHDAAFVRQQAALMELAETYREDPLGPAVAKLITSLFMPPGPADPRAYPPVIVPWRHSANVAARKRTANSLSPTVH